jgi:radical SAM protein with 4Fe4S-binding SPASM domain
MSQAETLPARVPRQGEDDLPLYVVWETTLRCDHACAHCGSRADKPRPDELSTQEMLEVADQLAELGSREVTLIGGEAYLRPDVGTLIRYLRDKGMRVTMQSGGIGLSERRCKALADAGLQAIGVSIDGPAIVHDVLRDRPGSYDLAIRALKNVRAAGMATASNMQINALTLPYVREHYETMHALEVKGWRWQVTVPMGNAADRPEWLLKPWQILEALDTMAELQLDAIRRAEEAGKPIHQAMNVQAGNNIGYFGKHEALLRGRPGQKGAHYQGCVSGRFTLGIESDGKIKGCPSLPTHPYVGGNIRDLPLKQIWSETPELNFVQQRDVSELWGFCGECYYGPVCMAGCSWTSHCTLGRRGNQPYCYHRAETLKKRGIYEELVLAEKAEGLPYDYGRYELVEHAWPPPGHADEA